MERGRVRECTQRQGLAVTGETLGQTCYGDDMTRCVCRRSFSDCDALGTHGAEQVGTFFFSFTTSHNHSHRPFKAQLTTLTALESFLIA